MAGQITGATAPTSVPPIAAADGRTLRLVRNSGDTRTRRNHGAFMLGGQLACVYSARSSAKCYSVSFELGAGTLSLTARMTAGQARAMAQALMAAADASDTLQLTGAGQA